MIHGLWFAVANSLALLISFGIASLAIGSGSLPRLFLATLAGFGLVAAGAVLLTGLFGALTIQWVVLLLALVSLCGLLIPIVRARILDRYRTLVSEQTSTDRPPVHYMREVALILTLVFVIEPLVRCVVSGARFGSDDFSYHGPVVAEWITRHAVVLAPFDYHAYFPYNAEALAVWFALPSHSDAMVALAGAYWQVLLWFGLVFFVASMGHSRTMGMIAAALVFASPLVESLVNRISSPDLAGAAMVFAALVFIVPEHRRTPAIAAGPAVFAGLLLGFAMGCKVSYILPFILVLCWVLFYPKLLPTAGARMRIALTVLLAAFVTGGGWYVRNWILTGNPGFPAETGFFAGPFSSADQARSKLITWILERPTDVGQWGIIVRTLTDWPPSLFAVALIGYVGTLWIWVRRTKGREVTPAHVLIFILGLAAVASFFVIPFSATYNEPHASLTPQVRFATLPFITGLVCLCCLPWETRRNSISFLALVLMGIIPAWRLSTVYGLLLIPLAFVVVPLDQFLERRPHITVKIRTKWLWAGLAAIVVGTSALLPFAQRTTDERIFNQEEEKKPGGAAWKALNDLPAGSQVAWFGNRFIDIYPLYGRTFDKTALALDPDGRPSERLDRSYARLGGSYHWFGEPPAFTVATFADNVKNSGADYVFLTKSISNEWPPQFYALVSSPLGKMVYNDGFSAIWKLGI
jgi:hypothetical protein